MRAMQQFADLRSEEIDRLGHKPDVLVVGRGLYDRFLSEVKAYVLERGECPVVTRLADPPHPPDGTVSSGFAYRGIPICYTPVG